MPKDDVNAQAAPTRNLLWTGGWDSTFRLLQILHDSQDRVQPWYVVRERRRSVGMEIRAMHTIRAALSARDPEWARRILPTRYIGAIEDEDAAGAIGRLQTRSHLGPQYGWLYRAAQEVGLSDLELSIHRDDSAYAFIARHAVPLEPGSMIHRMPEDVPDEELWLFQPFVFPILNWTKLQMQAFASRIGCANLLELTWFCHKPVGDMPCGRCNPCRYTATEGLARRIPRRAVLYSIPRRVKRSVGALLHR